MRENSVHTVRTTGVSPLLRTECTVLSRTPPPQSHLCLGLDQHLDASIIAPQTGDVQRSLSNAICNRWVDTALNEPLNLVWLVLLRLCPRHARISIALSERAWFCKHSPGMIKRRARGSSECETDALERNWLIASDIAMLSRCGQHFLGAATPPMQV